MQIEGAIIPAVLIEYWKLLRSYERSTADLPDSKAEKVNAQIRYSANRLDQLLKEADIRLVCFDGEEYSPELPVSAINAEDLEGIDQTMVERTVEPTLLAQGKVIHTGKVLLKGAS